LHEIQLNFLSPDPSLQKCFFLSSSELSIRTVVPEYVCVIAIKMISKHPFWSKTKSEPETWEKESKLK